MLSEERGTEYTLNVNDINQGNILKKHEMKNIKGGGSCYLFGPDEDVTPIGYCNSGAGCSEVCDYLFGTGDSYCYCF